MRVGAVAIDRASVDHWARAIRLGSTVEGITGRSSSTPREKALEFLISANWAIGEAAGRGLAVPDGAVARGLKERIDALPNGRKEFEEEITATGQTLADVKLEAKTSLALAALRESLSRSVPPVTQAQVAGYYEHHLQSFRIPDRRVVDLIEEIHGYAHAVALGKRLGPGARFRKRAIREFVPRETPYEDAHRENGRMVHAIFATPPGRVGGPVVYHGRWVLLVVRKLAPGSLKPLEEVDAQIS
ncbi:MAG TPA: peptidylprolyl isomerase, partial [Polyangiaceae bacterium]|nr:peptidylprolyl isomerase [Polyangiaceae bacterium]